jgi:CubicO group peptidase (beta-lactamase class C family)
VPESKPAALAQVAEAAPAGIKEAEPQTKFAEYGWRVDSPENHGANPDTLKAFHSALEGTDILCALTVKDGVIIDEYYKEGESENSVLRFNSCTKSVSGALVGVAIEQGLLSGVDAKLTEFFPQLSLPGQEDKGDITVEHLLTHTSGIYWNEWSGGDYFHRLSKSENWVDFVLGQDMASAPGEVFNYTTGGSHLLGAVIGKAAGMTAYEFGLERLFKPLGMKSVQWRDDPQGITDGGNGLSMTARDAAKLGQLYLNGGRWEGRQIIPEEWVGRSVTRQAAGSPGTGEYGYSWWLKAFGSEGAWYDSYYAMGAGGQYIIVVPGLELVTVMASRHSDTYLPQYIFNDYVLAAFS